MPGGVDVPSGAEESRVSSLPKAWTDRMIPLNVFTGTPYPGCPQARAAATFPRRPNRHNIDSYCALPLHPHLSRKMPFRVKRWQTTLVLSFVTYVAMAGYFEWCAQRGFRDELLYS